LGALLKLLNVFLSTTLHLRERHRVELWHTRMEVGLHLIEGCLELLQHLSIPGAPRLRNLMLEDRNAVSRVQVSLVGRFRSSGAGKREKRHDRRDAQASYVHFRLTYMFESMVARMLSHFSPNRGKSEEH
jgi:hypothetical protein